MRISKRVIVAACALFLTCSYVSTIASIKNELGIESIPKGYLPLLAVGDLPLGFSTGWGENFTVNTYSHQHMLALANISTNSHFTLYVAYRATAGDHAQTTSENFGEASAPALADADATGQTYHRTIAGNDVIIAVFTDPESGGVVEKIDLVDDDHDVLIRSNTNDVAVGGTQLAALDSLIKQIFKSPQGYTSVMPIRMHDH